MCQAKVQVPVVTEFTPRLQDDVRKYTQPNCSITLDEMSVSVITPSIASYRNKRSSKLGKDPNKCFLTGAFVIDGRLYCKKHAGFYALKFLLNNQPKTPGDV